VLNHFPLVCLIFDYSGIDCKIRKHYTKGSDLKDIISEINFLKKFIDQKNVINY